MRKATQQAVLRGTISAADTEQQLGLPGRVVSVTVENLSNAPMRFAFESGVVETGGGFSLWRGSYNTGELTLGPSPILYVASSTAGVTYAVHVRFRKAGT